MYDTNRTGCLLTSADLSVCVFQVFDSTERQSLVDLYAQSRRFKPESQIKHRDSEHQNGNDLVAQIQESLSVKLSYKLRDWSYLNGIKCLYKHICPFPQVYYKQNSQLRLAAHTRAGH